MHAMTIIQDVLQQRCPHIHRARLNTLLDAVAAALHARSHTLSNLARALDSKSAVRHNVKRMDRLLGNVALPRELVTVYQALAHYWLHDVRTLLIVVDWSDLNSARSQQLIRAAVALDGRSLTVYEEVHSMKRAMTPAVHQRFLDQLKQVPPVGCQPIIITDAGFRSTWFRFIEALGWHWVGRIRNRDMVRAHVDAIADATADATAMWCGAKTLYAGATTKVRDLGLMDYVRNHPITCRMVIVKRPPKGRQMKTVSGARTESSHSSKHAKAQVEPWLLASSCSLAYLAADAVVPIYAQRMQIEEAFRDTKNPRMGLGLSASASRSGERLAVLALIACLAEFVLRLIGQTAINQCKQYDLQLTNRRSRPEISCVQVGILLVRKALARFTKAAFCNTLASWRKPNHALQI